MDPLEVASAFHREVDGAGRAAEHVNRIRYPKKNTLGLGPKDQARRVALRTPTAGQVAKSFGNHLASVEFGKGLRIDQAEKAIAAAKKPAKAKLQIPNLGHLSTKPGNPRKFT